MATASFIYPTRCFVHNVHGAVAVPRRLVKRFKFSRSAFRATSSNATQVRCILRDLRLTLEDVYYPFIRSILANIPATEAAV